MSNLAEYAVKYYEYCHNYLKMVLRDYPENKMVEKIGSAKTPAELLYHGIATPHFWMKQAGRGFDFSAKFDSISEAIERWGQQLEIFKSLLKDEAEHVWQPTTSLPWIMIRSSNHLVHHLGMIIYTRNYHDLPPLKALDNGFNWGKLVDLAGEMHYDQL